MSYIEQNSDTYKKLTWDFYLKFIVSLFNIWLNCQ